MRALVRILSNPRVRRYRCASATLYGVGTMERISIFDAARRAGVSYSTFRKHIYGQQISALLIDFPAPCARGRKLLWLDTDIDRWLAAQSTYPGVPSVGAAEAAVPLPVPQAKRSGRPRKSASTHPGGLQ